MHLLSVAHFQSSLLGKPTQKWWLEMGNWQEVHSYLINDFLRNPNFSNISWKVLSEEIEINYWASSSILASIFLRKTIP